MLNNVYDTHESNQAELGARPEEQSKANHVRGQASLAVMEDMWADIAGRN
jgi:hypothetical protein